MNEESPQDSLSDAERLARLLAELATEDEVEAEKDHHFRSPRVLTSLRRERATTSV